MSKSENDKVRVTGLVRKSTAIEFKKTVMDNETNISEAMDEMMQAYIARGKKSKAQKKKTFDFSKLKGGESNV